MVNKKTSGGGASFWLKIFLGLIVLALIIFFLNFNAQNDLELSIVDETQPEPTPEAPIIENFGSAITINYENEEVYLNG